MTKMRVTENQNYVRDSANFAILNTNKDCVKNHNNKIVQLERQRNQEKEMQSIRKDLEEMKEMLRCFMCSNSSEKENRKTV